MHVYYGDQIPLPTLRHALLVMGFCFLPHFATTPWWLAILAICAISYRLAGSYWNVPVPPPWARFFLAIGVIGLLRWHYGAFLSSGFFIGVLVTFFWLKLVELHRKRDIMAIVLISFYVIFTALIINTNLWVFFYVILAVLANLSLLLKMQLPSAPIIRLSRKSIVFLIIAIPMSVVMFFIFPRITTPLWLLNLPPSGETSFREDMTPGSLLSLRPDDSTVMRILFNKPEHAHKMLYWKGLALSQYDGVTWRIPTKKNFIYMPLILLSTKEEADYEVMLESHDKRWLFYIEQPVAAWPKLQFSANTGLIRQDYKNINQRFAYGLISKPAAYMPLNRFLRKQNLQLPPKANPKLTTWAIEAMQSSEGSPKKLTSYITHYIKEKPFWYKLKPKSIGQDQEQLDRFWFDTREGYCEYYASAVAFIYRAAGVPARIMLGYYGGEWNPLGNYLNVRHMDAHAWVEYWQEGVGWIRFDPTAVIPVERIDRTIQEEYLRNQAIYTNWDSYRLNLPWLKRIKISYESFRFFWERWLLFYNQERQQQLLQSLGAGNWPLGRLVQLWIGVLLLFIFLGWAWFQWRKKYQEPLVREYSRLKDELNKLKIDTAPPASLFQQMQDLKQKHPSSKPAIDEFLQKYELLRLKKHLYDSAKNRDEGAKLIHSFRKKLRRYAK